MCDLPKDHCVQIPWKYIKVCGYSDPFCKNLNQRSLTPRWPLTPHLLRSHVWFYPRIIVSKSHENTSKYVDTVILFAKTWTKGHWPLDDLWPTSVEVTGVTLPKDHCVQVPWEYINVCGHSDQFCKLPHTYTTYYIQRTTYRMSDHIVSFWTQFKRDKKEANGKPERPKRHPIWAAHPRTNLSTKCPRPGLGGQQILQQLLSCLLDTYLPAKSTKLIIEVLVIIWPLSFLPFCTNSIDTIVCARLQKRKQTNITYTVN